MRRLKGRHINGIVAIKEQWLWKTKELIKE